MSSIPGCGIGVREKILATPSVGVGGEAHVRRNKCTDWASSKKTSMRWNFISGPEVGDSVAPSLLRKLLLLRRELLPVGRPVPSPVDADARLHRGRVQGQVRRRRDPQLRAQKCPHRRRLGHGLAVRARRGIVDSG